MKKILFTLALLVSFSSFGQDYDDGTDRQDWDPIEYYDSGAVASTMNIVDGIPQGECIQYYESGAVQVTTNMLDGLLQGECIEYYENGEIKEIKNYKDGELIEN